jgi:hypothetical protein
MDFYNRQLTVGAYVRKSGRWDEEGFLFGIYSDGFPGDGYVWSYHELSEDYEFYKDTFTVGTASGTLSVCIAPSGEIYIDNIQANLGTRLPSSIPRYNEKDLDAWNRHIGMYLNVSEWPIYPGHVLIQDTINPIAVAHPTKFGQDGVVGVAIGASSPVSGAPIATCILGNTEVDVFGAVEIGDLLFAGAIPMYEGYAVSSTYVTCNSIPLDSQHPFARALESASGIIDNRVIARIFPQGSYYGDGQVITLDWAPIIPISMNGKDTYLLTVLGDCIINGTGGRPSTNDVFILTSDGINDWKVIMGTGFIANGVILVPNGESITVTFQRDNDYWWETSRSYGLQIT